MIRGEQPIGEVIESNTLQFTVACYELYQAPPFGALVKAGLMGGDSWIYGLVYDVTTGSEPPGAQVIVRGRADLHDDDIYRAYPDLSTIMRTRFSALTVGFTDGSTIRQYLPPLPPPLHYSVYMCTSKEVATFNDQLIYLGTIVNNLHIPADELVAAAIRQARTSRPHDPEFALRAGRQLALLLKEEYDRLRAIISRIGP